MRTLRCTLIGIPPVPLCNNNNIALFHVKHYIGVHDLCNVMTYIWSNTYFWGYCIVGAMLVICDVNEYRKCVKTFKIPLVTELFEKLHGLCNLLVVVPENLKLVCSGEQLVSCNAVARFL